MDHSKRPRQPFTAAAREATLFRVSSVLVRRSFVPVAACALAAACSKSALRPQPPPAAPPPPEASAAADPGQGERVPPLDADDGAVVYGYVGMRPITGRVTIGPARWSGTFRFLGQRAPFTVGGPARVRDDGGEEDAEPALYDGRAHHDYLDCELDVGGSGMTGSLVASCLEEEDVVEVRGFFSPSPRKGMPSPPDEPFFVRTLSDDAHGGERYYAALAATPTEHHECAPFVQLVQVAPYPDRVALLYTLRFPCEEGRPDEPLYPGMQQKPPVVTWGAYVADVTQDEPPKLISSTFWAPLGDPNDPNELSMTLRAVDLVPGIELYFATLTDDFQSPTSSGGNTTVSTVAWAVTSEGRYGPTIALPPVESGHAGVCYSVSASRELWLVDIEGDTTPELLARTVSEEVGDRVVNGQHGCATVGSKTTYAPYSFDRARLTWQPRPAPKVIRERQLAAGRQLDVP
jgi:hypothetical protein